MFVKIICLYILLCLNLFGKNIVIHTKYVEKRIVWDTNKERKSITSVKDVIDVIENSFKKHFYKKKGRFKESPVFKKMNRAINLDLETYHISEAIFDIPINKIIDILRGIGGTTNTFLVVTYTMEEEETTDSSDFLIINIDIAIEMITHDLYDSFIIGLEKTINNQVEGATLKLTFNRGKKKYQEIEIGHLRNYKIDNVQDSSRSSATSDVANSFSMLYSLIR